jgi:TRAP-type C4-dicarboxylate transport system permease small subunit
VTPFLGRYARLLASIDRLELRVARVCLAAIVICIFAQVVSRYGFGRPIAWVEELATYCFIWGTFVGASIGLRRGAHLKVETFLGRLPPRVRGGIQNLTGLAIALFCLLLVVNGLKAAWILEWQQRTIALPVELPRYLFFSGPLVLASASMLLTVIHDMLVSLSGPRGVIRPPPEPAPPA